MTDTIHMARRSIRVQCGSLLGIGGLRAINMWSFALLHELRKGAGWWVEGCEAQKPCVRGFGVDDDRAELQILPK